MSVPAERIAAWAAREAAIDASGMRASVAGFPAQLAEAVERLAPVVEDLQTPAQPPAAIAVLGMGGSAVAADLVAAYTAHARALPLVTVRDYRPPAWLDERALVVASSYSGNTEETLSAHAEAKARGAATIAVTTGGELGSRAAAAGDPVVELPAGFVPRAALGWSFAACALLVARFDPGLALAAEVRRIAGAARFLEEAGRGWLEWSVENPALGVAAAAARGTAIVHGAPPVGHAAAYRWKSQLNENAKRPAWNATLPEHNHNEIMGWEAEPADLEGLAPVFLETPWDHPRTAHRFAHLRERVESRGAVPHRFVAEGGDPLEGMLWLCWLGDCASFLASVIAGCDPSPVQSIDTLKAELGRDGG